MKGRPYRGMKARLGKAWFGKRNLRWIQIGMTYRVGDIIHACDGFNHEITAIEQQWSPVSVYSSTKKGFVLSDIVFTDEHGKWHCWDSCCEPARSKKDILEQSFLQRDVAGLNEADTLGWYTGNTRMLIDMVAAGKEFMDDRGIILPEICTIMDANKAEWLAKQKK